MREPEPRECCATTTDCHHLDDCTERPAAEFLGRFQDGGGSASSTETTRTEGRWVEVRMDGHPEPVGQWIADPECPHGYHAPLNCGLCAGVDG